MILILSSDAVAAALLGALIETLGYSVRFARSLERYEDSIRRVRPKVCLVDSADPGMYSDGFLGRAGMRGVSVIVFGSVQALERVRALAVEHAFETILVPPDAVTLGTTLERALKKAG